MSSVASVFPHIVSPVVLFSRLRDSVMKGTRVGSWNIAAAHGVDAK